MPFVKENKNAWSPKLIPIICEACNQLDSLWKFQAFQSPCVKKKKLDIEDYFNYFKQDVSSKRIILWAYEPEMIIPYNIWNDFNEYHTLDWWKTYTDFKHNRYDNYVNATLEKAVYAVAGLFLAIINCELCRNGVVRTGWVTANHPNLEACLSEDSSSSYLHYCVVESKLFTHPIGWNGKDITNDWDWSGYDASKRFKSWFDQYEGKL